MAKDLDWFPFFLRDFDEGTREMTNEEVGAYLRLLYYQFHNGSIPADQARAGYITGERLTDAVWATLTKKFLPNGMADRLVNEKMREVRADAEERFKRRSEANRLNGQKGGLARGAKLRAAPRSERIASESPANGKPPANGSASDGKRLSSTRGEEKEKTGGPTTKSVSAGKSSDTPNGRARRTRRMPEDYKMPDSVGKWIQEKFPGVPVDTLRVWTKKQLEKIRNHEFNSPRSDWDAVIRNWVLECIDRGQVPSGSPRHGGDEEKAWRDTLMTASIFNMTKGPDESREAFTQRVHEANQRRLNALKQR
jgi:uncharacterized protein YdaU (DUF1376 family)